MSTRYAPRVVDPLITELLSFSSAVILEGARACGKSATGRHHAASHVQLDIDSEARRLAEFDASLLLPGESPRFIDEWQLVPAIWNHVRHAVDTNPTAHFLLAGSALPADDITRHSGAGRFFRVRMRPMSLAESGHSSRTIPLRALFANDATTLSGTSPLTVPDLIEAITRGGWPGLREQPVSHVTRLLSAYLDESARVDLPRLDAEPARNPDGVLRLVSALARHVATEVSLATLRRDAGGSDSQLSEASVRSYLNALERIFLLEDQPSWGSHLRSRDRVRKAPKRHFVDPSLAAAAIGATPDRLLSDLNYAGQLFESLVIRDLRVYAEPLDAKVRHYRDGNGREVDAIIERRDGSWLAVEIKLAAAREEEAARSLWRFARSLDTTHTSAPTAMVIITGGKYAYTRDDGIHVIPIGVLGP